MTAAALERFIPIRLILWSVYRNATSVAPLILRETTFPKRKTDQLILRIGINILEMI